MQRGVESILQIDAFAQAIGGDQHAAFFLREFGNLGAALVVAQHAGDGRDADIGKLAAQGALQSLGDVIGGGDVAAPDDGIKAFAEQAGDQLGATGELGVVRREGDGSGESREFAEFAAVVFRQGLFRRFDRRRGLAVIGLLVGRFKNVLAEIHFIFRLRQCPVTACQERRWPPPGWT